MNRTQLDARHTAVLGRYWVTMRDTGGRPPQQLLDELAEPYIEQERFMEALRDEVTELRASAAPGASQDAGVAESPPDGGPKPRTAATARSRRQPASRRSAK